MRIYQPSDMDVTFEVTETGYTLPNLYMVHLRNRNKEMRIVAISTGGGMVEIKEVNEVHVSIKGDYYEVFIYSEDKKFLQTH